MTAINPWVCIGAGRRDSQEQYERHTVLYIVIAAIVVYLALRMIRMRKAPASQVLEKIRGGAMIIDVRSPGEFAGASYS